MRNDPTLTPFTSIPRLEDTIPDGPPIEDAAPEYRCDPVTGRWVVIAPERSHRPMGLEGAEPRHRSNGDSRPCPFCPGQEYDTPNEVLAFRADGTLRDGPGWDLRVVPNKFPAVRPTATSTSNTGWQLFERMPGYGRHEVVIECPEHVVNPTQMSDEQFGRVFVAYRDRILAMAQDPALAYAVVFKNVGAEAGASLGHTHSQIVATPMVPDAIGQELTGSALYHQNHGRCVFCDMITRELNDRVRLVAETPRFVALAPFASRFPYETWVVPKTHESRYESISTLLTQELAALMRRIVQALDVVLASPAYNWYLHTAPLRSEELLHYHWHWELIPRTTRPAGLEWGSGCFVNAVAPELAADQLRMALPAS